MGQAYWWMVDNCKNSGTPMDWSKEDWMRAGAVVKRE